MKIQSACSALIITGLTVSSQVHGDSLGRLFFTPAERLQIDRARRAPARTEPPPRLDGIITRSDGPPILFLNGKAVTASPPQIHPQDGSASVTTSDGRTHRLKVGNPAPTMVQP